MRRHEMRQKILRSEAHPQFVFYTTGHVWCAPRKLARPRERKGKSIGDIDMNFVRETSGMACAIPLERNESEFFAAFRLASAASSVGYALRTSVDSCCASLYMAVQRSAQLCFRSV
jgi:hypothetical protein